MKTLTQDHRRRIGDSNREKANSKRNLELESKVVSLYSAGSSMSEVSAETGVPVATVQRWLKRLGVASRDSGAWHRGKQWTNNRRAHHPEKPSSPVGAPSGYDILTYRALGNRAITKQGYVIVHVGRKLRRYEHALVAEAAIGRPLRDGEVVHHINCIRSDNRPENLLVCSRDYHQQLHARMRRHPYWAEVERQAKAIPYHE